jgi:lipooligosaccharide transport system permease protein
MMFRVLLSTTAFLLVAAAFGTLHSFWTPTVLLLAVLIGMAVAAPVAAYTASIRSDSYLAILFRFAVLPMSLFSGVFFPIGSLPEPLRWVAWALPLWHGVDLTRAATLGRDLGVAGLWHVLYLSVWCVAGWFLARWRFQRRLVL